MRQDSGGRLLIFGNNCERADTLVIEREVLACTCGDKDLAAGRQEGTQRGGIFNKTVAEALIRKVENWQDAARCNGVGDCAPLRCGWVNPGWVVAGTVEDERVAWLRRGDRLQHGVQVERANIGGGPWV